MILDRDEILKIIADKHCRKIISAIKNEPKSAIEISSQHDMLLSTVYRRIQWLQRTGILKTSIIITNDGKKTFTYKSKIEGIYVYYSNDDLKVRCFLTSPSSGP